MKHLYFIFIVAIILSGCATSYHTIQNNPVDYNSYTTSDEGIKLSYENQIMFNLGNKKQVQKALKNDLSVVAVRIENNSDLTIIPGKNCKFYSGNQTLYLYTVNESFKLLKQKWPYHFFYLGLTPFSGTLMIGGFYAAGPVGIVLGPGLTLYNSLKASRANKRMLAELQSGALLNKEIKPGETLNGIIVFEGRLKQPLYLRAD